MPKIPSKLKNKAIQPYWQTNDQRAVRLYHGDVLDVLQRLPSRSVQMVVTSPPYWGLRSYATDKSLEIGSEQTPDQYVTKMVAVFDEIKRVLRRDGTVWLNIGDSYSGGGGFSPNSPSTLAGSKQSTNHSMIGPKPNIDLASGNLVGIPWRLAFALQADGWILRQDIIWSKPSPMPESVTNRCTKAHEYIFLLTQSSNYYYDAEAIKTVSEPSVSISHEGGKRSNRSNASGNGIGTGGEAPGAAFLTGNKSNKRSVWTVAHGSGYDGAHFATFPPKLIEPCVLSGSSEYGACAECGAPYKRMLERGEVTKLQGPHHPPGQDPSSSRGVLSVGNTCANTVAGVDVKTIGWERTCYCTTDEIKPCVIMDPFLGSGTSACMALQHGRHCVGIDLSEQYLKHNAVPRIRGTALGIPRLAALVTEAKRSGLYDVNADQK